MMNRHHRAALSHSERPEQQQSFQIGLTITVTDAEALWFAAFIKGIGGSDAATTDITDVIGPAEDPSILECLAMLTAPASIPGCRVDDYAIDATASTPCMPDVGRFLPSKPRRPAGNMPMLRLAVSN